MDSYTSANLSLIPSAMDLLLAVPRLAQRAGSFALVHMPEAVDNIAGKIFNGGSMIADATGQHLTRNSTITNTSSALAQNTAAALEAAMKGAWNGAVTEESPTVFTSVIHMVGRLKNFGGIFSYLTSRWAVTTFVVAILLNRTQFYASSRTHLRLKWHTRLTLYLIPILAFLHQILSILQAMKCQTSPSFPLLRYGDPLKNLAIDFAGDAGFAYRLSSTLLFWQDDATACAARHMARVDPSDDGAVLLGSAALLYWFFLTLCTSQFVETLACALQGKHPMPETGMTIFEHSLAFAECEALIHGALGLGVYGGVKGSDEMVGAGDGKQSGWYSMPAELQGRLNVPPEVLMVCLISCFSHLTSALLAVSGQRHKVRLVNTGVWACCYMTAFIWSFARVFSGPADHLADLGILRFPTVCIAGFIPHMLILIGITLCGFIYGLALLTTAMAIPSEVSEGMGVKQRLRWAYENLQANVQFSQNSAIRIRMSEDFYTTLLKIGFNVLTAASEAVYLNEGSRIQVAKMTWLEQKRIDELASSMERRRRPDVPIELLSGGIAKGLAYVDQQNAAISNQSPYARERKSRPNRKDGDKQNPNDLDSGLGLNQRRSRMHLTGDFVAGIFWLVVSIQAQMAHTMLQRFGIQRRPAWLLKAAGVQPRSNLPSAHSRPKRIEVLDFYVFDDEGKPSLPLNRNVDVEAEMRRRQQRAGTYTTEEELDTSIYGWWQKGGWFGDLDNSGDYQTKDLDDDNTSMISMSTNTSYADDEEGEEESGQRTPTQEDIYSRFQREDTPVSDAGLDLSSLSRLLNPQTNNDREEARLLSYSLQSTRPMTRNHYRRAVDHGRAELLSGLRSASAINPERKDTQNHQSLSSDLTPEEQEERDLEQYLLSQRSTRAEAKQRKSIGGSTWESGAEGMGAGGPQCVVCHSEPRTVLVWPCGCLSMCDDCRVGLAARNYTKCICCRTDIAAYSRLYVP